MRVLTHYKFKAKTIHFPVYGRMSYLPLLEVGRVHWACAPCFKMFWVCFLIFDCITHTFIKSYQHAMCTICILVSTLLRVHASTKRIIMRRDRPPRSEIPWSAAASTFYLFTEGFLINVLHPIENLFGSEPPTQKYFTKLSGEIVNVLWFGDQAIIKSPKIDY